MQTPVTTQETEREITLRYAAFRIETALVTFTQLAGDGSFIFNNVALGDAALSVPPAYVAQKPCKIDILSKCTALIDAGGNIYPVFGIIEFAGAIPNIFGRGLTFDGSQSNATFADGKDVIQLNSTPSSVDFGNIFGATRLWPLFDSATFIPSPSGGALHGWRLTIQPTIKIMK